MAVSNQETVFPHVGNGVTVDFAYSCQIFSSADLVVFVDDVVATTGFTVNGVGNATGGTVTFLVAPADGVRIRLERIIKLERATDYQQNGDFLSLIVNRDFDRLWQAMQRFNYYVGASVGGVARVLRLGDGDTNGSGAYRAQQNRIQDLADPVAQQDAVNLRTLLTKVAEFSTDGTGQAVLELLEASSGSSLVGYSSGGTAITTKAALDILYYGVANVRSKQYAGGAVGDDVTNDTAAFAAALADAKANKKLLLIPETDAAYLLDAATLNFAWEDGTVEGGGFPTLHFTGTGNGFILDSGGGGAYIKHMTVRNLHIKGGPNITNGFYSRGMVIGGIFENIEVRECNNIGFELIFSVMNTYRNLRVSNDKAAMTTHPVFYYRLTDDGTAGNKCQANTFINCDASGKGATSTSTGWALDNAVLNNWIGGNSQSLQVGVNIRSDLCRLNTWRNFDLEDNKDHDIIVKGHNNAFEDITSQSGTAVLPNIDITTGKGTQFRGGYLRWVNVGASSSNTHFDGCGIDQNSGGGIGIQGSKSLYTMRACTKINGIGEVVGTYADILGNGGRTDQNMTSSRALATNYTNDTGNWIFVTIIVTLTSGSVAQFLVDGVERANISNDGTSTKDQSIALLVPAGSVYRLNQLSGSVALWRWTEFR